MENLVQIIDRSEIMDKEAIIQDQINLLLEEQKKDLFVNCLGNPCRC